MNTEKIISYSTYLQSLKDCEFELSDNIVKLRTNTRISGYSFFVAPTEIDARHLCIDLNEAIRDVLNKYEILVVERLKYLINE